MRVHRQKLSLADLGKPSRIGGKLNPTDSSGGDAAAAATRRGAGHASRCDGSFRDADLRSAPQGRGADGQCGYDSKPGSAALARTPGPPWAPPGRHGRVKHWRDRKRHFADTPHSDSKVIASFAESFAENVRRSQHQLRTECYRSALPALWGLPRAKPPFCQRNSGCFARSNPTRPAHARQKGINVLAEKTNVLGARRDGAAHP